jgi:hypothetical protein
VGDDLGASVRGGPPTVPASRPGVWRTVSLGHALIATWFAAGVVLAATWRLSIDHLWVLSFLPIALWALAGLVLVVAALWRWPATGAREALGRLGLIAVTAFGFAPLATAGSLVTERIHFRLERARYARVVAAVTAGDAPLTDDGPFLVDEGPPRRVAFPWPGGVIDNWCGIIYDPSGVVMSVNDLPSWSDRWRYDPATQLFGGDMTGCRVERQPYYFCCFT